MLSHLFRLIWNKKKAHALLIVEIWASFLVLFGLSALIIYNVRNYRKPLGFTYENVWAVSLTNNQDTTEVARKTRAVFQRLNTYPEVESVSRMGDNFPFSSYYNGNGVAYQKATAQVAFYITDEHFAKTLTVPLTAGNWYRAVDSVGNYQPAVINQKAKEALFGDENPIGKIVSFIGAKTGVWKVVGVINTFKGKGEFMTDAPAMFELLDEDNAGPKTMLVRVKPGTDAVFEAKLVKDITAMVRDWSVEVTYLTDARKTQQNVTVVPVTIAFIIAVFLLINVALGLFGVLNVSITNRRNEIGLRRAIGATGSNIAFQFIGEVWVLATFALLIGLGFAFQFQWLNVFDVQAEIYWMAIGSATFIIYAIVTLCALFPSRQAALIQPAVALHEE